MDCVRFLRFSRVENVLNLHRRFYASKLQQSAHTIKTNSPSLNYCVDSLLSHDYENFLCSLLLPENVRVDGLILRAFNVEIACIQKNVTEKLIGRMRYKFWEDALDTIYDGKPPPEHPICRQLHYIIRNKKLTKMYFKRLISARQNFLETGFFKNCQSAEIYAENINSSLYYLLLECAGIKNINVDHAASHLGKAQGLTNLLRGTPESASSGEVMFPRDLLIKHNIPEESILRGSCDKNVKDAAFELATKAHQHLQQVEKIIDSLEKGTRVLFLPKVPVEKYLARLRKADFDVFNPKLQRKDPFLQLKLCWERFIRI